MLRLNGRSKTRWEGQPFVVRLSSDPARPASQRGREAVLRVSPCRDTPSGYMTHLPGDDDAALGRGEHLIILPAGMDYLNKGDILYFSPLEGRVSVLYRCNSDANVIVLTERCNCHCIMCPQPPRDTNAGDWTEIWLQAIPLMRHDTPQLVVSGGEPTTLPDGLRRVLAACRNYLPATAIQVLTNGRMFNYLSFCADLAIIDHPGLMFGIPLYSDLPAHHDYIVQSEGAFDQTIRGIMNLKRYSQRVEVRVVILRQNADRLPDLATFMVRNLPFADHVALMCLEPIGYAALNWKAVWIDPLDYQAPLRAAVRIFEDHGLPISIYNHQLCVLDPCLWRYARKSISDWKNEYFASCGGCRMQGECGGFFASSRRRRSRGVHAL